MSLKSFDGLMFVAFGVSFRYAVVCGEGRGCLTSSKSLRE